MHGLSILIDVSSPFLLHRLLIYGWWATVASGVAYLALYCWSFGDATLGSERSGFATMEANTGPEGWDEAIERVTLH